MEPAPYGGYLTRTVEAENQQQELLGKQQVEISINGNTETLRPEALHLRGVDNLSTSDITNFVDYYLNYDDNNGEYTKKDEYVTFRVQWIDDSRATVVFKTHEDAWKGLNHISISGNETENPGDDLSQEYVASIIQEREAKPYNKTLAFLKHVADLKAQTEGHDLFEKKLEKKKEEAENMDEDDSAIVLYCRQATQLDRKVKNAAAYSRYYLLHGEPDRYRPLRRRERSERTERGKTDSYRPAKKEEEDLFAHKLGARKNNNEDDNDDLFAHKLRDRSPVRGA